MVSSRKKTNISQGLLQSFFHLTREVIDETLWPTRCASCDIPGELLCEDCRKRLPFIEVTRACPLCGAPWGLTQCTECNPVVLESLGLPNYPLDRLTCVLVFNRTARRIVTLYKDHHEFRLGTEIMAPLMARYLAPEYSSYTLGFIPSTKAALNRRGFDQAEALAKSLSEQSGLPVCHMFERPQHHDQRNLTRRERHLNTLDRFTLKPDSNLPDKILLIDDVCTTGSTLTAAALTLRHVGVSKVSALTFARVI